VALRVDEARRIQEERFKRISAPAPLITNADADGDVLTQIAPLDARAQAMLTSAAEKMKLSARGYHRTLRVARTIADLAKAETIDGNHVAEALSYRRIRSGTALAA
jgi:magnesium chelatase family protein